MLTGVNPGQHGIFDFFTPSADGGLRPISGQDVHAERIWNVLNDYGIRTVLVNVPIFFPAEPVDGAFVSGMMTPGLETEFAYPRSLLERLRSLDYPLETRGAKSFTIAVERARLSGIRGAVERVVDWFDRAALLRWKTARELVRELDARFVFVVFEGPDRLQHSLMDGRNDWAVLRHYRLLDRILKELMNELGEGDVMVVVSDHGFCRVDRMFYINAFLKHKGWLSESSQGGFPLGRRGYRTATKLFNIVLDRPWIGRILAPALTPLLGLGFAEKVKHPVYEDLMNLDSSSAYVSSRPSWGVRILRNGETANRIYQELEALTRMEEAEPFTVHRREDVFHGTRLHELPEIVLNMAEGTILTERFHPDMEFLRQRNFFLRPQEEMIFARWDHSAYGLLLSYGHGVSRGHVLADASIYDIFPTVLKYFGIPTDLDLDGHALTDIVGG
jgi:predicted AlkP superfamily phosphohydrolase/phosphomutase